MAALSSDFISELLGVEKAPLATVTQSGPLRWYDREMRCAKRGCTSPTYCKVDDIPHCMIHALRELNERLS